jgi:hypothetical protein
MTTTAERHDAHQLVERLPADQLSTVVRFMEFLLLDPISRSLAIAPVDDEPLTGEEAEALEKSKEWFRHNQGIPHDEVLAEFGLTAEDFPLNRKS